ncbi:flagellar basal body P-ring formation chaperone FlgA [Hylemonella gracilis]|uniref:Flagellar protein FlgA n=1 Tax=Hylemonella gracilis ATCC 19624 TaxID=887062 RepID=F3KXY1_9BURK|nr:flagellar basal body P-ring formation chaperone FlgA [Hylemonella gracilis]EGI75406.1 flagellar protein FlgA [Hylemonella gracilis ATCC 19624]
MNSPRYAFEALRRWTSQAVEFASKAGGLTRVLVRRGPAAAAWLSWLSLGLAMLVMGWSVPVHASQQTVVNPTYRVNSEADLPYVAQHWLERNLPVLSARESERGPRVRLQAQLGRLDGRLRLAPCAEVEVYTPTRLWGNSNLGMRCVQGATRWSVTLPVQVQVMGSAWVLRANVPAGQAVTDQDLERREVDLAEDNSPVLATDAWEGQVTSRGLRAGQTLRQNMFRAAKVFTSGAQVRVLVQGSGFQISAPGRALSVGVVGQLAQVRMENGRVMNATVVDARTVRVEI